MCYTARIYISVVTLKRLNLTGTSPRMLLDFFQKLGQFLYSLGELSYSVP